MLVDFSVGLVGGVVSILVATRLVFGSFFPVKITVENVSVENFLRDRYVNAEDALYIAIEKGVISMSLSELREDRNAAADAYLASLRKVDVTKP